MYIGILNSGVSGLKGHYSFNRRGVSRLLPPNKSPWLHGKDSGVINFGSGSLCMGKPVGWKWDTLMGIGLDIKMDLSKECYIGAVCIGLKDDSQVRTVEIYSDDEGSSKCIGRFDAQTGELLKGEFTIPVGFKARNLTIRFEADLSDIVISKFDIVGAVLDSPVIYPSPVEAKFGSGKISLDSVGSIIVSDNFKDSIIDSAEDSIIDSDNFAGSDDADFILKHCRERFLERFNVNLTLGKNCKIAITLGLTSDIRTEGYTISVSKEEIKLSAANRRGFLYAIETLIQLVQGGEIPICEIEDYPYMSVRGFHFGLPPREEIEFTKRLIRYVLVPMRYNTLFVEFAGGMRFDKHPEISEAWVKGNRAGKAGTQPLFPHGEMVADGELLEKSEVRDLIEYAKKFGFEVIPEVQSFGHVQYITYAHPDIAEVEEELSDKKMDTRDADQPPSKFYDHSYCPSNEKSYKIIYDIIDEIVEVVKPERYVHMGHDEIYEIGLCSLCKDKDHSELYAKHVNRMYNYLKKKGLSMMIWCDMLQPTENYKTFPAIAKIPKDIVMLDFIWYFHFDIDMEDHILPYGFNTIMGNMYSSHYPRYESRISKKGMIGGEVSTWCRLDEYHMAKKGKVFDLLYSAQMLWSKTYDSNARQVYTEVIQKMIPQIRDELRGIAQSNGVLGTAKTILPIPLPKAQTNSIPSILKGIIRNCRENIEGYPFDLSNAQKLSYTPVEAEVFNKFRRIVFLHTTTNNAERIVWKPLIRVGEYIVKYVDGTEIEIPVEYAGNIRTWTKRYAEPLPQQYYRHQGYIATYFSDPLIQAKSECGRDITVLGYEWINPKPDTEILTISCKKIGENDADILLFGLSGVK